MIKIKFFYANFNTDVQKWLDENQNIEIISTNLACNRLDWAYSVLYKEKRETNE